MAAEPTVASAPMQTRVLLVFSLARTHAVTSLVFSDTWEMPTTVVVFRIEAKYTQGRLKGQLFHYWVDASRG